MPGIVGYVLSENIKHNQIENMEKSLLANEKLTKATKFSDDYIELSQVYLSFLTYKPIFLDDIIIYFHGELYNFEEIKTIFKIETKDQADAFIIAYKRGILREVLNKVNGHFVTCLYDKEKQKILLFTDRFGQKFLYWYYKDGDFAFAGEIKAILALKKINKDIHKKAVECFLDLGFIPGEHTLFEHIKLIKPASILEFDLPTRKITQTYYWKFSEIKKQNISFDDAIVELGQLFIDSIKVRIKNSFKIGVPLSGGRDSRMIVAALHKIDPNLKTFNFTVGNDDCGDILLAKTISKKANQEHKSYNFKDENWLEKRLDFVWKTDGMSNLMHLHECIFFKDISKYVELSISGIIAGEIFTDFLKVDFINQRINLNIAKYFYKYHVNLVDIEDDFYDTSHYEAHILINSIRKFSNYGLVMSDDYVESIKPYTDNSILEFVFSLPDEYRKNGLYSLSLLKAFPEFYKKIPWQRTGKVVGEELLKNSDKGFRIFKKLKSSILKKKNKFLNIFGIGYNKNLTNYFLDYNSEIKKPIVVSQIRDFLKRDNSIYSNYIDEDYEKKYFDPHLNGEKDFSEKILALVTLEYYLRRIFNENTI